ncbi:hypothetical protein PUR61_31025 [Streptomyces sp. BE20]|uniref:hypothetical protein n=1 Tax=Streptomyces sp. BE20 TaxID=3002525 RepID=UPI002E76A1E7|nr:hypothetical protein [Streptomyces sp. BE20]MEE1826589.1 hypothetical protein [Streptomyces sp. BE20]
MSLPGADELFRTTGGMALSPSLASRSAAEAPRPETARAVNGTVDADGAEGAEGVGGAEYAEGGGEAAGGGAGGDGGAAGEPGEHRRAVRRPVGAAGTVPAPAQPGGQGGVGQGVGGPGAGAGGTQGVGGQGGRAAAPGPRQHAGAVEEPAAAGGRPRPRGRAPRRPTGRERHDEKITVYVSAEELMDLEHTRLVLRGEHGLAVDRGRIVREAIAVVLADLEQRGEASILVRRLRGR